MGIRLGRLAAMRDRIVRIWNGAGIVGQFTAVTALIVSLLGVAVWIGYSDNARSITGFGGKTLWDWMEVLGVPLAVALLVFFGAIATQGAGRRAELERELQRNRASEEALQSYLSTMRELVLDRQLSNPGRSDPTVARVAYAQTLATLRALDGVRKGFAIRFLFESQLIVSDKPVISLDQADLTGVNLTDAGLKEVNFDGAFMAEADFSASTLNGSYLRNVDLTRAILSSTSLVKAHLEGSDMSEANLSNADLDGAFLIEVDLSHADLTLANLREANLKNADLSGAFLGRVDLSRANLNGSRLMATDFTGAVLTDTDLSGVDLTDANLEYCQMTTAGPLVGAILPDGSTMTSTALPRFQQQHGNLWLRAQEAVRKLFRSN